MRSWFVIMLSLCAVPAWAEDVIEIPPAHPTHVGEWMGDHVEWRSSITPLALFDPHVVRRIVFAAPMPAGTTVDLDPTVATGVIPATSTPVLDSANRIVALDVRGSADSVALVARTPPDGAVDPPLVAGIQRITLRGLRLDPRPPSPLVAYIGHVRHEAVSSDDVARFRAVRGRAAQEIYVLPDERYLQSGITPYITPDGLHQTRNLNRAAGLLSVALLILAAIARRASSSARAERADAYLNSLEAEFMDELSADST